MSADVEASAGYWARTLNIGNALFSSISVGSKFTFADGTECVKLSTTWYKELKSGRKYRTGKYAAIKLA